MDKEGNQVVDDAIYETLKRQLNDGTTHFFYPVRGNPSGIREMDEGWVYVFECKGSTAELTVYGVEGRKYYPASKSNGEYKVPFASRGIEYIEIPGFFPADGEPAKGPFYLVVSDFALSAKRLDQLKTDREMLEARGLRLIQSEVALLNSNNKEHQVERSRETLREAGKMIRHITAHDYTPCMFRDPKQSKNVVGLAIAFPRVSRETERRLDAYRLAHFEYLKELNSLDDDNQRQKFLADVLLAHSKTSREFGSDLDIYEYVDGKKLLKFKGEEINKYWKREEAAYHLIKWMKSSAFYQWVIDHASWFEKEDQDLEEDLAQEDHLESLTEALSQVFLALAQCQIGQFFLESERRDRNSIYNQLLKGLAELYQLDILVHNQSSSEEMDLGTIKTEQSPQLGKIDAARRLNGHLTNMVYSCYATMAVHFGAIRTKMAVEEFKKAYLFSIQATNKFGPSTGPIYRFEDCELDDVLLKKQLKKVQYLELNEKLAREFEEVKRGKQLFDSVNRLLQVANLCSTLFFASDKSFDELSKEEKVKYVLNGVGAAMDVLNSFEDSFQAIAAGSVLGMGEKHANKLARHVNPGKVIPSNLDTKKLALKIGRGFLVLQLASCAIDFCMAADDLLAAVRKGDDLLTWSASFAMTGYALSFVGSLAWFSATVSGSAIFGILTGPIGWICLAGAFICCLISWGLKLVHKTRFEKWLERCVFSRHADRSYPLEKQITDLFNLLSDFTVEAKSEGLSLVLIIKPGILTRDSLVRIDNLHVDLGSKGIDVSNPNTYVQDLEKYGPKKLNLNIEFGLALEHELLFVANKDFRDIETRVAYRKTGNNRQLVEEVRLRITFTKDQAKEWKRPLIRSAGGQVTLMIKNSMFHNVIRRKKSTGLTVQESVIRTKRSNSTSIKVGADYSDNGQTKDSDLKNPSQQMSYVNQEYLSSLKFR